MSEDQKEAVMEDLNKNIRKCFKGLQFPKIQDKYDVILQYDKNAQLLSLNFTNQTTKNVFKQDFDKDAIAKMTINAPMKPERLVKLLMETLASTALINKNMRMYISANTKQGTIYTIHP